MSAYVQYGCGVCAPAGWSNFDASPTLLFERLPLFGSLYTKNEARFPANVRYGDIVKGLPISRHSCRGIYSSHVLEHLSRRDCEVALRNTFDYLETGGIFRLVVPDLHKLAEAYLEDTSPEAAHTFMSRSGLGEEIRSGGALGALSRAFGNSRHRWLWDERSMTDQLKQTGFRVVRKCQFNDCADPRFAEVEEAVRFMDSLALEATR